MAVVEVDRVILNRTFVPEVRRGHGVAAEVVRVALVVAGQRRWKIVPRCSYVARFIDRHPQFSDLVSQQERELE